jgi:hypothetical protein
MSQCSRATSRPKAAIARAPTEPTSCSSLGGDRVQSAADAVVIQHLGRDGEDLHRPGPRQSPTRRSGVGEVNRLATSTSMTCPWVRVATSRTGQARSTIPARSSRRQKSATTGSARSAFSTLGGP